MKRIRFGVTGSGHMGQTHAEAIKRLPQSAELVAVWGGSRAAGVAARYGVICEQSAESLAMRKDIDAVVIATPPGRHFEEATSALRAGKHVLIEKPMATTVSECDQLIALAKERGVLVAVGYNARFMTTPLRARELMDAKAIGDIRTIHFSMFYDGHDLEVRHKEGSRYSWYRLPENGGFLIDGLPHGIDMIRWLTGLEVKTAMGFCRTFLTQSPSVRDSAVGILELSNGGICSINTTLAAQGPYPREYFRLSMIGSAGILDLDVVDDLHVSNREDGWRLMAAEPKDAITFGNVDSEAVLFGEARMNPLCNQMAAFIRGLQGGAPLQVGSGFDGRAGLAPCLALIQSSEERRLIVMG